VDTFQFNFYRRDVNMSLLTSRVVQSILPVAPLGAARGNGEFVSALSFRHRVSWLASRGRRKVIRKLDSLRILANSSAGENDLSEVAATAWKTTASGRVRQCTANDRRYSGLSAAMHSAAFRSAC